MEKIEIDPEALATMRERGDNWAVYQNVDLSSRNIGHVQFMQYGETRTHKVIPAKCPDTAHGLGWRYSLMGTVNLMTGLVEAMPEGWTVADTST